MLRVDQPPAIFCLPILEPAFEISSIHDAQYEKDTVPVEDVVHDSVIPDPQTMERVGTTLDRLDALAADTSFGRHFSCQSLQDLANARPNGFF